MKYEFVVDEEVARWALEVHLITDPVASAAWWTAFSNPTAGPWKRLMGKTKDGMVEVYRYQREEDRPDLIVVSDKLRAVAIIEAKDNYERLIESRQMLRSTAVMMEMERQLIDLGGNDAWGDRAKYSYLPGFLWGNAKSPKDESSAVVKAFRNTGAPASDEPVLTFALIQSGKTLAPHLGIDGMKALDREAMQEAFNLQEIA